MLHAPAKFETTSRHMLRQQRARQTLQQVLGEERVPQHRDALDQLARAHPGQLARLDGAVVGAGERCQAGTLGRQSPALRAGASLAGGGPSFSIWDLTSSSCGRSDSAVCAVWSRTSSTFARKPPSSSSNSDSCCSAFSASASDAVILLRLAAISGGNAGGAGCDCAGGGVSARRRPPPRRATPRAAAWRRGSEAVCWRVALRSWAGL